VLLQKDPALRFQSLTQFLDALPATMEAVDAGNPLSRMRLETSMVLGNSPPS
jgi:hypothetical protein